MTARGPKDHIFRPLHELDAEHIQRAQECIKEAKAILALPKPSTFLGKSSSPPRETRPSS